MTIRRCLLRFLLSSSLCFWHVSLGQHSTTYSKWNSIAGPGQPLHTPRRGCIGTLCHLRHVPRTAALQPGSLSLDWAGQDGVPYLQAGQRPLSPTYKQSERPGTTPGSPSHASKASAKRRTSRSHVDRPQGRTDSSTAPHCCACSTARFALSAEVMFGECAPSSLARKLQLQSAKETPSCTSASPA